MTKPLTLEQIYQILDSVDPDEYGCKKWPRAISDNGYGWVSFNNRRIRAHKIALERKLGRQIQPGHFALHTCDYRPCVNEDHLYEGTAKDNAQDRKLRNPESFKHTQGPDSPQQLGMKAWRENPENQGLLREYGRRGLQTRWGKKE